MEWTLLPLYPPTTLKKTVERDYHRIFRHEIEQNTAVCP